MPITSFPAELTGLAARTFLSLDDIHLLTRMRGMSLSSQDWFFRFCRFTPGILNQVANNNRTLERRAEEFSAAVSIFRFGNIFKLTCGDRTHLADAFVIDLAVTMDQPRLLEVGVSDGHSATGLLGRGELFGEIILTDRYNCFYEARQGARRWFFDADGRVMGYKIGCLFVEPGLSDRAPLGGRRVIETVNPLVRERYGIQSIRRFDMFADVLDQPVQIIKCANLLNVEYFPPDELRRAVHNLMGSLSDGGHLVVSQNNDRYTGGEAAFVLTKTPEGPQVTRRHGEHAVARHFPKGS